MRVCDEAITALLPLEPEASTVIRIMPVSLLVPVVDYEAVTTWVQAGFSGARNFTVLFITIWSRWLYVCV